MAYDYSKVTNHKACLANFNNKPLSLSVRGGLGLDQHRFRHLRSDPGGRWGLRGPSLPQLIALATPGQLLVQVLVEKFKLARFCNFVEA